jgi:hypothetical protein
MLEDMNYCNGCGAQMAQTLNPDDGKAGVLLIFGGTFILIAGLLAFFAIMKSFDANPLPQETLELLIIGWFGPLVLIFSSMLVFGWRRLDKNKTQPRNPTRADDNRSPMSFKEADASQLASGDPEFVSVTESTTRLFEKDRIARK